MFQPLRVFTPLLNLRFNDLLPALVLGQLDVVLHAHVDHVAGRADEAADASGEGGHPDAGQERDRLAVRGDLLLGDLEKINGLEFNAY